MYSVKVDSILHVIVAYEAIQYLQPLDPQVRCIQSHWEHSNDFSQEMNQQNCSLNRPEN
jgi:hypothetical protein